MGNFNAHSLKCTAIKEMKLHIAFRSNIVAAFVMKDIYISYFDFIRKILKMVLILVTTVKN